jgi:hypothetical protein
MLRIFTGWDAREAVGWHAFAQSVIEKSSVPVALTPVSGPQRDGTNAFTYSRFLVPYHCNFQGMALFVDGADMMCRSDPAELLDVRDKESALFVVKHNYETKHARKYVGTPMEAPNEDYPRKNWSSVILWDCGHPLNRCLTPEYVENQTGAHLHRFAWLPDKRIGELQREWNWLDEYGENPSAKMVHWTCGQPGFYAYRDAPHSHEWRETVRGVLKGMD